MSCPRLLEPVDAEHLAGCAECRAAKATFEGFAPPANDDLTFLKAAALEQLQRTPDAKPWWISALLFVGLSSACLGIAMQAMSANVVQHVSMTMRQATSAAWAATLVLAGFLAVMPGAKSLRYGLFVAVAGCFALTLGAASGVGPEGFGSIGCAVTETMIALLPLTLALVTLTGFAYEPTRALAAGICAMSAGMLTLHLHCPNGTLLHQAAFHLVPVALVAGLLVVVRRKLGSRSYVP